MTFTFGLLGGLLLGTAVSVFAQLAPFDAPLEQQLHGQRQEQYLRLERELERREHQSLDPCRR